MYSHTKLVLPYDHSILVHFDYAGSIVGQHLVVHFIDHTFVLESRKIIYFFQLERIDEISVFVDQSDGNVLGQMSP